MEKINSTPSHEEDPSNNKPPTSSGEECLAEKLLMSRMGDLAAKKYVSKATIFTTTDDVKVVTCKTCGDTQNPQDINPNEGSCPRWQKFRI